MIDTTAARYFWQHPYYPSWFIPDADLDRSQLPAGVIVTDDRLSGHVHLPWTGADAWFEEDEEVYGHPRDPHKRVDVRDSSRHVQVVIDGTVVADSHRPVLLFETSLPTRYYLPELDVRLDLLTPTTTSTICPYKGTAQYWTVTADGTAHADLVWSYRHPYPELTKIAGHLCFYNERVDLLVDGVHLDRPRTNFS